MIEVTKTKRHGICGSCGSQEDIFDLKISFTGTGWTTIMLCRDCRHALACELLTVTLKDIEAGKN